jgi:hypothetical protein
MVRPNVKNQRLNFKHLQCLFAAVIAPPGYDVDEHDEHDMHDKNAKLATYTF